MPNYCNNVIRIKASVGELQIMRDTIAGRGLLSLVGRNSGGVCDNMIFRLIDEPYFSEIVEHEGVLKLVVSFTTAWDTPIQALLNFYEADPCFQNPENSITCLYYESGNNFAGVWQNGVDDHLDDVYGKTTTPDYWENDVLGRQLEEAFGIAAELEENAERLSDDGFDETEYRDPEPVEELCTQTDPTVPGVRSPFLPDLNIGSPIPAGPTANPTYDEMLEALLKANTATLLKKSAGAVSTARKILEMP